MRTEPITCTVFAGPTLHGSALTSTALRGRAVQLRPPVGAGDLFRLQARPGDVVLVVDGVYQQRAPLRHKEIMAALDGGVEVWGAASYGALRAAELHQAGMRGLGRVFEEYRSGRSVGDDEVAVLHSGDAENRQLTVARISLSVGVHDLRVTGALDERLAATLLSVIDELHFTRRSPASLRRAAVRRGIESAMEALLARVAEADVKRQDAVAAVGELAAAAGRAASAPGTLDAHHRPVAGSRLWRTTFGLSAALELTPYLDGAPSRRAVLACQQLFADEYAERHRRYVLRTARETVAAEGRDLEGVPALMAAELLAIAGHRQVDWSDHALAGATPGTADWSPAERVLVRTFRLRPGPAVYDDVPPEALGAADPRTAARQCAQLLRRTGAPRASATRWRRLLGLLWAVDDDTSFRLCALERGFRDAAEAIHHASVFDHATVATLAAVVAPAS